MPWSTRAQLLRQQCDCARLRCNLVICAPRQRGVQCSPPVAEPVRRAQPPAPAPARMATQPVVPRLPVCPSLLAQLRGEGADADDIAALLARDGDSILAGTSAFRRPTPASAAALTAHGFTHDGVGGGPPTKVVIGTSTEQLVRDLVPKLVRLLRLAACSRAHVR